MSDRHQRQVLIAVAIGAGLLAFLGLAFPQAARPFVSVLLAVALAGIVVLAVGTLHTRTTHPETSPFDRRSTRVTDDMPSDLLGLTLDARRIRPRGPITSVVFWRIRRLASHRLRDHHGLDPDDEQHHPAIARLVSPSLFAVLTDDQARVAGDSLPTLITELEQL